MPNLFARATGGIMWPRTDKVEAPTPEHPDDDQPPAGQPTAQALAGERPAAPGPLSEAPPRFESPARQAAPAQPARPAAPAAQPRLSGLDPQDRLSARPEEDLLDIPAFLRRQAN